MTTANGASDAGSQEAGLLAVVERARVVITVGAGGVGKTTTAAALALLGARIGRRTLVMTIDPARRLAASLGLQGGLDHTERAVPAEKLRAVGLAPDLLYAMMLDQKQAFDEVIRRQSPDEESARRVLENKLYREVSTRLPGGQEYAAMEKLYGLVQRGGYDLLVVDTPPTANAMDFFEAPRKMVDLVGSPAVSLFLGGRSSAGRFSLKLLSRGAAVVFRRLTRFVGGAFLDDVAQYFAAMQVLLEGFRERAGEVAALLARPDVAYVIVASPDRRAVDEALRFFERFRDTGAEHSIAGFVINRVHERLAAAPAPAVVRSDLAQCGLPDAIAARLVPALLKGYAQVQVLAAADAEQIARLAGLCGGERRYVKIPLFDEDVFDIGGLAKLSTYLR